MRYTMRAGRFFSAEFPTDSAAIVLNEAAYKQLGFEGLEGQTVINFNAPKPVPLKLIGVVKDFNFENLRSTVKPMAMVLGVGSNVWMVRESKNEIAVRIAPGDPTATIEKLESIWKKYSSSAFEFSFLDQNIEAMFRSEQRMGRIVFIFASLAIIIACLGSIWIGQLSGRTTGQGDQHPESTWSVGAASRNSLIKRLYIVDWHRIYHSGTAGLVRDERMVRWICISHEYKWVADIVRGICWLC